MILSVTSAFRLPDVSKKKRKVHPLNTSVILRGGGVKKGQNVLKRIGVIYMLVFAKSV